MKSLQEIKSILKSHKNQLFKDYPLKSMAIFGSYSRGDYENSSDLDILVEFNDTIGIEFIDLGDEMEKILGLKVDLVSRKGVREKYLTAIQSELIYV